MLVLKETQFDSYLQLELGKKPVNQTNSVLSALNEGLKPIALITASIKSAVVSTSPQAIRTENIRLNKPCVIHLY